MHDREWKPVAHSEDSDPLHEGKHSSSEEIVTHLGVRLIQMFALKCRHKILSRVFISEQQHFEISLTAWANPSRFCAVRRQTARPRLQGCGRWQGSGSLCALDRNTVRWKCQYDLLLRTVLTSTSLLGWFLTWEAFCLSQKIIWGTVRNWTKEKFLVSKSIHIHTKAGFKLLSSQCKRASGWPVMYYQSTEHRSLWNNVMQQKPDLMQIEPINKNHKRGEIVQLSVLRVNADSEHKTNWKAHSSDFIDSPLWRAVFRGAWWGHVEWLCFPF